MDLFSEDVDLTTSPTTRVFKHPPLFESCESLKAKALLKLAKEQELKSQSPQEIIQEIRMMLDHLEDRYDPNQNSHPKSKRLFP